MAKVKYYAIGLIIGLALLSIPYVFSREKLLIPVKLPPFTALGRRDSLTGIGENGPSKLKDFGASPVASEYSPLDKSLQSKEYPDIIHLDYSPIVLKEGMDDIDVQDALIALALQRQVVCKNWEMYGGGFGGWPVCKAAALLPKTPCVVYSFGIMYDWTFDDAYNKAHGCTIRTFDPSMGDTKEHEHKPGVFFYPIGLSDRKEKKEVKGLVWRKAKKEVKDVIWNLDTYANLLKRFGEENATIPYLKFDVETMEWKVLENMFADGILKNVMQLSFELHVDHLYNAKKYFQIIKKLDDLGFRRWFYHHRLNGLTYQVDQAYININYLKRM